MKRRTILIGIAVIAMVAAAALAPRKPQRLLLLEWAAKAPAETPPIAIMIELGLQDKQPTPWSGRATVQGAKVVRREGHRFQKNDKLVEPDSWQASSNRAVRVPPNAPAIARIEPIVPAGIVLHLTDVKDDAALTINVENKELNETTIPLKDILGGESKTFWNGAALVRRVSAAIPLVTEKTEDDFPAAAYGPDGTLWVAYISYHVKEDRRRIELNQIKEQPADFKEFYTPEFRDQLFVKYYRDGKWSEPIAITGPNEDLVRCAIAVEGNGTAWVAYSANRKGNHDIYVRPISPKYSPEATAKPSPRAGPEINLTQSSAMCLSLSMCTDGSGAPWLAFQTLDYKQLPKGLGLSGFRMFALRKSHWGETLSYSFGRNQTYWDPALVSTLEGDSGIALANSHFENDYDVRLQSFTETRSETKQEITGKDWRVVESSAFEARPSVACDPRGRLWIAYEEGPERWGKDFGAFELQSGNPLYNQRSVRVVCLENGKLMKPVVELPTSGGWEGHPELGGRLPQYERAVRYAYPRVGIDGKGRIWLTYREKFGTRQSTFPGSYWLTFARRLDGDKWSPPIEIHHSDGLLDHRPVLLPHASGGLVVVHNTDGRYSTPHNIDNQIYLSHIDLPGEPVEPKLVPHEPGVKKPELVKEAEEERAGVKRARDYRIELGGKKYQLLRGEFHRHTEISWDGGPDGSLEDMFRYAIDAAAMDWIGNGDHDNGAGREYAWWLTQKFTDAYHVKNAFTPMFTYERSVGYPHGHRNCMFVQRGVRTLPRLAPPGPKQGVGGAHPDDTKMLYRYLHEFNGICASHTCATGMGTDWRDNDPVVEPIVEIYQGDRMSYEYEGCPRAGYDPKSNNLPAQIGGWQPAGFLNHAFKKGYKLGFQASSDHWSTHISYCTVIAERHDREAIMDGLKRRHCYGATDNIIVDVRSGQHLMGDEFKTTEPPTLEIKVIGTKPLATIDILKDSQVVESIKPGKQEYAGKWTDPKPSPGVHYYYVRVLQADDEIAWASPMWIEYAK